VAVLRWSPTVQRIVEAARDRIMRGVGTESLIDVEGQELALLRYSRQWRRPLSIEEVNRMAATPEVRARPGRP